MRILLDTDPGIDDALAILYLAAQEDVEILAAGSVHGNVSASQTADNALRVLDIAGLGDVPVAIGARRPLAQLLTTSENVHGKDGLGNTDPLSLTRGPIEESAAEQMVRLARANPGELSVLALGPLTNLALAVMLEPRLPELVDRIVVMGGAVREPGNITTHAEANIWHDPEAADLVLASGFDLTLVGLDVTHEVLADEAWLADLAAKQGQGASFATKILRHYVDFAQERSGRRACPVHDPLAAEILVDPSIAGYREVPVEVELRGTHTRGMTVADFRYFPEGETSTRSPVKVAIEVDADTVLRRLRDALL